MYQVIAKLRGKEDGFVIPYWIAKTYQRLSTAQKFIEKQINNSTYTFTIEKI